VAKGRRPADDFSALEQAAWSGLLRVHGRLSRSVEQDLLARSQLTHAEFDVLRRLSTAADTRLRIQDLATQNPLTRSGVSRVVERLERMDLVVREGAPEDGRGTCAVLTADGAAVLRTALAEHVLLVRTAFLDHFKGKELEAMAGFWQRVEARSSGGDG
jgi:DNA-binding MarR family transcriptional regulator